MNDRVTKFANIDEVSEFIGGDNYLTIFGGYSAETVMSLVETGMVVTEDGLYAIHYSEQQTPFEAILTLLANIEIRSAFTRVDRDICINDELSRVIRLGGTAIAEAIFAEFLKKRQ